MQQFPQDLCLNTLVRLRVSTWRCGSLKFFRLKALYEYEQKLCTFISCSNTCQMHQNKHAGSLSNQQPAGLMQCTSQQTHSSVQVFFTVPKALVVSGDSTSSAGFSSGTSGLGYRQATTSFQKQNSNQSLFKIFQSILEHPPARKRSFINIKTGFLWVLH